MARKTGLGLVLSVKSIKATKKILHPITIAEDFVTFVCFKNVQVEKLNPAGKTVKEDGRYPILLIWDGEKLTYTVCQKGQDLTINGKKYVIDRDVDDNMMLPSEEFVEKLMDEVMLKKMMKDFNPQDYFEEILKYLQTYFWLEKRYLYIMVALFSSNLAVFDAHISTPYLYIQSPVPECGKSHLGESISNMWNSEMSMNWTAPNVYRAIHSTKMPIIFDEIKGWSVHEVKLDQDIRDILSIVNAGYQANAKVGRLEKDSEGNMRRILYNAYSTKVFISTYDSLPKDTESRCLMLSIQNAPRDKDSPDYAKLWKSPQRIATLEKIRELGLLFRLKYGMEIYKLSRNSNWLQELDISDAFKDVRNRYADIFDPLIILALKYMPTWKEELLGYIKRFIEMREKQKTTTPSHSLLYAMKTLYQDVEKTLDKRLDYEWGVVELEVDKLHGAVLYLPVKAIEQRVALHTDLNLFGEKYQSIVIGKLLSKLGFVSGKTRRKAGIVHIIKVSQLKEMCSRYLGGGLGTAEDDRKLSQGEKIDIVREILLAHKDGIDYDKLKEKCTHRLDDDELTTILKHFRTDGWIVQRGKGFTWYR